MNINHFLSVSTSQARLDRCLTISEMTVDEATIVTGEVSIARSERSAVSFSVTSTTSHRSADVQEGAARSRPEGCSDERFLSSAAASDA